MPTTKFQANPRQLLFRDMVFGTLVYSVVLGFFNDYTSILYTKSYSTTFLVAIVMQILTYLTLTLETKVVNWFKLRQGSLSRVGHILSAWLILFLSKFVFLEVIDFVFGQNVEISGFVGLIAIILTMTIAKELIDFMFEKLAD